uniref:Uncharacterized protein n=1 Tax=viral metagenome TaxID=1070528 RepID=A0A6M3JN36_9ZZZZ
MELPVIEGMTEEEVLTALGRFQNLKKNKELVEELESRETPPPQKPFIGKPYECKPKDFWTRQGISVIPLNEPGKPCFTCRLPSYYEIEDKYSRYTACKGHTLLLAKKAGLDTTEIEKDLLRANPGIYAIVRKKFKMPSLKRLTISQIDKLLDSLKLEKEEET